MLSYLKINLIRFKRKEHRLGCKISVNKGIFFWVPEFGCSCWYTSMKIVLDASLNIAYWKFTKKEIGCGLWGQNTGQIWSNVVKTKTETKKLAF